MENILGASLDLVGIKQGIELATSDLGRIII